MGPLSRCLARGEYGPALRDCPLFESECLQVTWAGEGAGRVTVAVAASSPDLALPDLLLLARPPPGPHAPGERQLMGLFPLRGAALALRGARGELRVRLGGSAPGGSGPGGSGRAFSLRLLAPRPELRPLLARWARLLRALRGGGTPQTAPPQHPDPQ